MAGATREKQAAEMTISAFLLLPLPVSSLSLTLVFQRYARIDPAQELSRIRHSISLVEAYIYPHRVSRRAAEPGPLITPKKEVVEQDVKPSSPGVVGTQTSIGLYAGPTAAATQLLIVCSVLF